jgi:uncharacterized membrane protein YfcA
MYLYLPIAGVSANVFVLVGMGAGVGFLSGMFGVGGGFLITPLLIFYNIPPPVAVATGANQVIAASFSGVLSHSRRGTLDLKMGLVLLAGGAVGSVLGIGLFTLLRRVGQLDLTITILYVVFLGVVGGLMLAESIATMRRAGPGAKGKVPYQTHHSWIQGLPFKMRFKRSRLYVSVIPILVAGVVVGVLAAVMGVGGGFIMIPVMIYLLRMPTNVVIGTSLFQIIFTTAVTTVLQAATNRTVDVVLAFLLMIGAVFGAQVGAQVGRHLRADHLRALLAIIVLVVGVRMGAELVVPPDNVYSINPLSEGGG